MHAAVRWLILNNPEATWDPALGFPINQEDLGFTLMTFAYVILDGLDKLGINVRLEEQQGFLETWKTVGRIMGVQEALIPDDMAAAKTLYETVQKRQDRPCAEGKAMTQALLDLMGKYGLPAHALMRHFLSPELADGFGIKKHPLEEWLINILARRRKDLNYIDNKTDFRFRTYLVRRVAMRLIRGLVTYELGGEGTRFTLPTSLNVQWTRSWTRSAMPTLWRQFRR